ncbi:hypothetical protein Tco_1142677 [Tanacetum coccineum]
MNEDHYHEQNSYYDSNSFGFDQFQPPQYTINHPIFNAQNEFLNSQNKLMEQMTSICDMVGQYMQKKEEDRRIAEDQAAKDRYWKIPICYDDDEGYTIATTPVSSTKEPVDSLIIEDEHLDTIPKMESDELIKSSIEDLVHTPSESDGISKGECDLPVYDDFSPKKDEVLDDIISIPPGNGNDHFNAESSLIESVLNRDNVISSPKIDFLIEEFAGELALIAPNSSGIVEADLDPKEDIRFIENLMYDNSFPRPPETLKDDSKTVIDSNNDYFSSDDDSYENIDYVDVSPPDAEIVSLEVVERIIPEVGGVDTDILLTIKDDTLREKLLNVNLLIANIEALKDNPVPSSDFVIKSPSTFPNSFLEETNTFDNSLTESETFRFNLEEISSGSTTTRSDYSLPDYEAFYLNDDHIKEKSSGSTTTHADFSLPKYDSFIFDLSINPFPPADRSDFYHEEFADELAHIISPPDLECFYFKIEPNPGDLIDPRIRENVSSTKNVNLPFEDAQSPLLAFVVWIFLAFLTYPVTPPYLFSYGNEDTIFDHGIPIYHSFTPGISHRDGTFMCFNVYPNINESPIEIFFSTCFPMDNLIQGRVKLVTRDFEDSRAHVPILVSVKCQKPGHLAARLGCAETKVDTWDDLAFKLIILEWNVKHRILQNVDQWILQPKESFRYLGSVIHRSGRIGEDVDHRIGVGSAILLGTSYSVCLDAGRSRKKLKQQQGRPKLRWEDRLKKDMKELLLSEEMTSDRNAWRDRIRISG